MCLEVVILSIGVFVGAKACVYGCMILFIYLCICLLNWLVVSHKSQKKHKEQETKKK